MLKWSGPRNLNAAINGNISPLYPVFGSQPDPQPTSDWNYCEYTDNQWNEDSYRTLFHHRAASTALMEHCCEEPRQDKEQLHSKAMPRMEKLIEQSSLVR